LTQKKKGGENKGPPIFYHQTNIDSFLKFSTKIS